MKNKLYLFFIILLSCASFAQERVKVNKRVKVNNKGKAKTYQGKVSIVENSPIHSEANINSRVIALALEGEQAQILGFSDNYYYISYSSLGAEHIGYIHRSKIQLINTDSGLKGLNTNKKIPSVNTNNSSGKGVTLINASFNEINEDYVFKDCIWLIGGSIAVLSGSGLMNIGYVVLGRDIVGISLFTLFSRSKLVKNLRSWGALDQIEVLAQVYDVMGSPRWTFAPGEKGQIVLTIINRGLKKVKNINPQIKLESSVFHTQFGNINLIKGDDVGRRRYFGKGFILDPGESMTSTATFEIPATYPSTTLDVKGFLSRSVYGTSPLAVDRVDEIVPIVNKPVVPIPSVAVIDIEKNIPQGKRNPNAYAVVFGIEQYKNVSPVTYARRDAYWIREYFLKTLGVPDENLYYKIDVDAGKVEFDKVFSEGGWLDKRVRDEKSDLYIYYAGHGAPDFNSRTAFLIPYDGDPNYASQTGYAVDKITANLSQLEARSVTVFLDACFSGANRENEILLAGARPVFLDVNTAVAANVTLFSAASGNQISSSWSEKQHGIFSYWLMKGIQGSADANRDNRLTVEELGAFIRNNVSTTAGKLDREQTPVLQTMDREKILVKF